ncbi:hypothetical protein CW702_02375, partial [Candidatus Bathyarchaeota archaeon]
FNALVKLGMLVILFMIGFNLDLEKIRRLGREIVKATVLRTFLEGILGSILMYLWFPEHVSGSYIIALITAFSFATVGEAVLLPILSEFKVLDTAFGQLTLGIGTFDDVVEVLMLSIIVALPAFLPTAQNLPDPTLIVTVLCSLFIFAYLIIKLGGRLRVVLEKNSDSIYVHHLLVLFIFFFFASLGGLVFEDLATIGAILGGIVTRHTLPKEVLEENEKAINFLGYIFLSPLFFLSIGAKVSLGSLIISPALIIFILLVANSPEYLTSFILFRKLLGVKHSLLLGLGLSVRFSTSIIVQYILYNSGLISLPLYSALIASSMIMLPIIIGIYSWGLTSSKPP